MKLRSLAGRPESALSCSWAKHGGTANGTIYESSFCCPLAPSPSLATQNATIILRIILLLLLFHTSERSSSPAKVPKPPGKRPNQRPTRMPQGTPRDQRQLLGAAASCDHHANGATGEPRVEKTSPQSRCCLSSLRVRFCLGSTSDPVASESDPSRSDQCLTIYSGFISNLIRDFVVEILSLVGAT